MIFKIDFGFVLEHSLDFDLRVDRVEFIHFNPGDVIGVGSFHNLIQSISI